MFYSGLQSIKGNVLPRGAVNKRECFSNYVKSIRADPENYTNICHRERYGPPSTLNWTQASQGGGGPIATCDFQAGVGGPDPLSPLWIRIKLRRQCSNFVDLLLSRWSI